MWVPTTPVSHRRASRVALFQANHPGWRGTAVCPILFLQRRLLREISPLPHRALLWKWGYEVDHIASLSPSVGDMPSRVCRLLLKRPVLPCRHTLTGKLVCLDRVPSYQEGRGGKFADAGEYYAPSPYLSSRFITMIPVRAAWLHTISFAPLLFILFTTRGGW